MPRERNITQPVADFGERDSICDVDDLLHPARAFERPSNVVNDPDLTLNEKRAILASWASDACAVEAAPSLRSVPGGKQPARFDDVMDALRELDKQTEDQANGVARYRRSLRRGQVRNRRNPSDQGEGQSLH